MGRLPVLDVSGRGITSITAALRFVAHGSGLYSGSAAQLALIDAWTDSAVTDLYPIVDSVTS